VLERRLAETAAGRGGLVLLAGEAGVGKTRLATDVLRQSELLVLAVQTGPTTAAAFGPIVGALRAFLRVAPDGLPLNEHLSAFLPALLPELGSPPAEVVALRLILHHGFAAKLHQPFAAKVHQARSSS
jgi:hypothetical protein